VDGVRTRAVLVVAGWLLAAGGTATTATVALNTLGQGLLGPSNRPLTQEEIQRRLAADRPTGAVPSPGVSSVPVPSAEPSGSTAPAPAPPPAPPATPKVFATDGGTVRAQCAGAQATLTYWSPNQGFHTDDVARGPAAAASVKFESATAEIRVTVTCAGGVPQASITHDGRGKHGK
jgi:hypothetical protein